MTSRAVVHVAKKEFMENVLSWRFVLALALATLILVTSVLALGAAYRDDASAYAVESARLERDTSSDFSATRLQLMRVLERPNPLSIFVGGAGDDMRRSAPAMGAGPVMIGGSGGTGVAGGSASPMHARFEPLDLGFVAGVVMTFMAVLFSYDAVSGERERGTLKLMLANPVPKDAILVGKYLGGMASILLPFALAVTVALSALSFTGVHLTVEEWTRLALVVALFVPLVSAFYLLGLFVSSLAKRSSTSLLALTLVWLVLVFGAGNVAAVVADATSGAPEQGTLEQRFAEINDRVAASFLAEMDRNRQAESSGNASGGGGAFMAWRPSEEHARLSEEAQREREALIEDARRKLDNELARAEALSSLSPVEAFRSLATSLARSDYWTYKAQREAAQAYTKEVERARLEWMTDNPGAGPVSVRVFGPGGVAVTDQDGPRFTPPAFQYETASASEQLSSGGGVRDLLVLLAYNALGFLGAYAAFLRYDVR